MDSSLKFQAAPGFCFFFPKTIWFLNRGKMQKKILETVEPVEG